ncbi:class I SAM-dependent methyltransferase [uncultured Kordia sp.]|uniref:class I SAM-dependent methyltransferase n=1 Tax=uncultured Kordia sp. TaxID=507699 RepID=UPI002617ABDF|nr:class I SAM-dependent methyltransferase [uncultured Kordia sp.]
MQKKLPGFAKNYTTCFFSKKMNVVAAYDLWANTYDSEQEKGNLVITYNTFLVEQIFTKLSLKNKIICDIGSGTGHFHDNVLKFQPEKHIACDTSEGMLHMFTKKFPEVETHVLTDNILHFAQDNSIDIIFSSLVIGYIKNLSNVLNEWKRALKANGFMIITLLHPELNVKNSRNFKDTQNTVHIIKSCQLNLKQLNQLFANKSLEVISFSEKTIDNRGKSMFLQMHKGDLYKTMKDKKIVCGFLLKKSSSRKKLYL